jgi:hypothetical protein
MKRRSLRRKNAAGALQKGCQCRDLRPPAFAMIDTVTRSPTNLSHTVGNLLPGGDRSSTMNAADSWLYETYVEIKA